MEDLKIQEYDLDKIKKYDEIVKVFKDCFQNEVISLLEEAKEEIEQTKEYIKLLKQENQKIFKDCHKMANLLKKECENNIGEV